jgi:hypothetical protein
MGFYTVLFESMINCCDRIGLRHELAYTVTMIALGLGFRLNLLIFINLLWTFGAVPNPYLRAGRLHPQHYVYALLCIGFVANTVLARIKFNADNQFIGPMPELQTPQVPMPKLSLIRTPAAAYVLGCALLFLVTLTVNPLIRRQWEPWRSTGPLAEVVYIFVKIAVVSQFTGRILPQVLRSLGAPA